MRNIYWYIKGKLLYRENKRLLKEMKEIYERNEYLIAEINDIIRLDSEEKINVKENDYENDRNSKI